MLNNLFSTGLRRVRRWAQILALWALTPDVKIFVLPGGQRPERKTDGAIGYDVYVRAVVSAELMDPENPLLRKTLVNFRDPPHVTAPENAQIQKRVEQKPDGSWVYKLYPGEFVTVGLGFVTEMPFPVMYWVSPRSGLASRYGVTLMNAPGTIDPDYRGEACAVIVNNGTSVFEIALGLRISQALFQWAMIPNLIEVTAMEELSGTGRSADGLGSTGLYDQPRSTSR
ncbi:hypothetical protein HY375_00425 [Candidatus Berkelbacteria bacterium]|nr:hypothetical protein [Candidatus Berkelbacteria bacterium]